MIPLTPYQAGLVHEYIIEAVKTYEPGEIDEKINIEVGEFAGAWEDAEISVKFCGYAREEKDGHRIYNGYYEGDAAVYRRNTVTLLYTSPVKGNIFIN